MFVLSEKLNEKEIFCFWKKISRKIKQNMKQILWLF